MRSPLPTIDRDNLLFHLAFLTRRWRQILDTEIQESGLTDATWRPLLHLSRLGDGIRQKDLAESLVVEGPSLVRVIGKLLEKGLIQRIEDVSDRRAKLLFLTSEGQSLVDRVQATVCSLERDLLDSFTDYEISQIVKLIERLETYINAARCPDEQCLE